MITKNLNNHSNLNTLFREGWGGVAILFLFALLLTACSGGQKKYVIGVSQCSEDSWREKLHDEMDMSTYFYDNVSLRYACANDDADKQMQQIDSLVKVGIDLLVVSPQQLTTISPAIDRAYDKGIPVILFDRKTDSDKYTTFMGADNEFIGGLLGHYVADKLNEGSVIVEIQGQKNSSPTIERSKGFGRVIAEKSGLQLITIENNDWTEESGAKAMEEFLKTYHGRIDCIFGGNDRIAMGARKVLTKHNIDCTNILFAGVDALPSDGGGMQLVRDGELTISAVYPTHGDEVLQLAINILNNKPYERENMMNTSLVTRENAKVMLMQNEEIVRQGNNLRQLNRRVDRFINQIDSQRIVLYSLLFIIIAIVIMGGFVIRAYHLKKLLSQRLAEEKEKVERQRDELEVQRDKLIEANIAKENEDVAETGEDILTGAEGQYREENQFLQSFKDVLEAHISDSDLSVEDIAEEMKFSRVQLYRKVKALTGISPVEYIKQTRLKRAKLLLADSSLNISEIAYKVGFSSPGYFTKCYKDMYGENPTSGRK